MRECCMIVSCNTPFCYVDEENGIDSQPKFRFMLHS